VAASGGTEDVQFDAGIPLRDGGKCEDAIAFYERNLPRLPNVGAHAHYAYALLKAGRLREGSSKTNFVG